MNYKDTVVVAVAGDNEPEGQPEVKGEGKLFGFFWAIDWAVENEGPAFISPLNVSNLIRMESRPQSGR